MADNEPTAEPTPPTDPNPPVRDGKGRFLPGNSVGEATQFPPGHWAAAKHTMRTDRWPPELEVLRDEVDEFLSQTLVDEGDPDDVPARRKALLNYRARVHRRIVQLDGMLEIRGLVDKRGKLRSAWLQRLEALIATARGLDSLLGLARRQKRVPSLSEYLEAKAQAAEAKS